MLMPEQLEPLVLDAFSRTMVQDRAGAADALSRIDDAGEWLDMYQACCGFAEFGRRALLALGGDEVHPPGRMWVVREAEPGALERDPPAAFAARFLIAHCNGDSALTEALFRAVREANSEEYMDSVCALLAQSAGVADLAFRQSR